MKRLASFVALALLVPLSASAAETSGHKSHSKSDKGASTAPKGSDKKANDKTHPRAARDKSARGHDRDTHADPKRSTKHDDFSHHEPNVPHGVLVSKASARHHDRDRVEHGKKELPLLPASATEKLDKKDLESEDKVEKKGHDSKKSEKAEKPSSNDKHESKKAGHDSKAEPKAHAKKDNRKAENTPAKPVAKVACFHEPVEIVRGAEVDKFALQRCEGGLAPFALERLSIVLRPSQVARPVLDVTSTGKAESLSSKAKTQKADKKDDVLPASVKRVDPGLVERLDLLATHFKKPGSNVRVSVVSGYRPMSTGSLHSHGRAMDIRIEGVQNEELVAFCKTIPDTGCGYYPNSSFVHVDVRDPGAGHVSWIDASGPGETPRYVTEWPPKAAKSEASSTTEEKTEPEANAEHGTTPTKPQEMVDGVRD